MYIISGIQQVGIGVENLYEAWKFYIEVFNMDIRILEDNKVAELMLPYTGGVPQRRHACIAVNMQGGGGFEVWQYAERKPKKIDFELKWLNIGNNKVFETIGYDAVNLSTFRSAIQIRPSQFMFTVKFNFK